ncbi:MAG: vanadium-dependent haloperoxidase [Bacteroidia bacterium]|nr:vanadium-dependent haloperoxidase [Bacteroidia bacterium]MDW8333176.1 vanadium-dependent haloperoxidase [Bacteroidia bacterium]
MREWNATVTEIIRRDGFSPPVASRIYAYLNVALYEGLRRKDLRYLGCAGQLRELKSLPSPEAGVEYEWRLAANRAAAQVARALVYRAHLVAPMENKVFEALKNGAKNVEKSVAYGELLAKAILDWAQKDRYAETRSMEKYAPLKRLGAWEPTPPLFDDAVEPHWGKLRPFVLDSAAEFAPVRPPRFDEKPTSRFYQEAMEVYRLTQNLQPEHRAIAAHWDCNPLVSTVVGHEMSSRRQLSPGGHWIVITGIACDTLKKNLLETAAVYLQVSIALADAFIGCWHVKYTTHVMRPETFINRYIDKNWRPMLETPQFPEYTSGHSTISRAAAEVLTARLGDNVGFRDTVENFLGLPTRNYVSFLQAADEAAISRIYGGIHFRQAMEDGAAHGKQIGKAVLARLVLRKD